MTRCLGHEGFFGLSTPDLCQRFNPYEATHHGADFVRNFSCPDLDFACIHMYADQWLPKESVETSLLAWSQGARGSVENALQCKCAGHCLAADNT